MDLERILVVDDDAPVRESLTAGLRRTGYSADSAEDGAAAIRYLQAHPVDVVVTDINMPTMDGLGLIRHLRKEYPDVRVLAMSGNNDLYLEVALMLGASAVIGKPFTAGALAAAIKTLGPWRSPLSGDQDMTSSPDYFLIN